MSGHTQPTFAAHWANRNRPRSSAALLCHEAPQGLELPRSGTGAAQQPGLPPLHPLRCRGYSRFHYLQPHLCPAEPGSHRRDSSAGGPPGLRARRSPRTKTSHRYHGRRKQRSLPHRQLAFGRRHPVLSRSLERIAGECKQGAVDVVHHARAVKHRLLEISRAAKCLTQANQQRMRDSYQKLLALTRGVVRQAGDVIERWAKKRLKVVGKRLRVEVQIGQLRHFLPLVEQVITQTKQRVLGGDNNVDGKVLSLFEVHTEVIRKGKAHKPNEFGRLVRIDEVENGIVSGYQVLAGNPADTAAWIPALQQHQACFGRAPEMASGDRGFFSAKNEGEAHALGVKKVALPARGRLSAKRAEQQKQRWFRRGLRWRAGIEATISTLKHPFSMWRATYKGDRGFQRYVGWCVITKNLFSIARYQQRRRDHDQVS